MEEEIPELTVEENDNYKKVIYLAKELLLTQERLNIVSGSNSCHIATKATQNLVRFKYVKYENIQTLTEVRNEKRIIKLIMTLKRKSDFRKIYDENKPVKKNKKEDKEDEDDYLYD